MKTSISNLPLQRPTWAEVNLDALHSNTQKILNLVAPARILAVVKADGYGHGALAIARELAKTGVAYFGTATVEEAIEIRDAGITTPLVVLGAMTPEQLSVLNDYTFYPSVHTTDFYQALAAYVRNHKPVDVHLKVDTGMGRLGMSEEDAARILQHPVDGVRIQGLFTHFACADIPNDETMHSQIARFNAFLESYGSNVPDIHAANSAAILNYPQSHYNLVRPGLLLYGYTPMDGVNTDLEPILSIKSKIISLRKIASGQSIGYGRTFVAKRDTRIATVPIGYSDGLRRRLSNKLQVEVKGKMCPIVGNISMDLCMIDVTDHPDVQLYNIVTFLNAKNSAWDWARLLDSIPWEILCLIGARVPRVYFKNGEIADVYYP
ncbi:MAG TPA: alanine racemase [Acidobacteriota bacterium]|nr:alanine racemase [Acidobacteriota bacterium]